VGDEAGATGHAGDGSSTEAGGSDGGPNPAQGGSGATTSVDAGGDGGQPPTTVGNACTTDAECDDESSCTGVEKCVDGACAAGEAVQCPAGLVCSDAKDNACVFAKATPWILYRADEKTKGSYEVFGMKPDQIGVMDPVKISPDVSAGTTFNDPTSWSPDGSLLALVSVNAAQTEQQSYLVRFGDRLPETPFHLTKGLAASNTTQTLWSPSGKALALVRADGVHLFDLTDLGNITHARASGDAYTATNAWIKSDNELIFYGKNAVSGKFNFVIATRSGGSWTQQILVADVPKLAGTFASPDRSLLSYVTIDAGNNLTLFVVETAIGSKPTKLAGPAPLIYGGVSPDTSHVLLAITTTQTDVRGGTLAEVANLPVVKAKLTLTAQDVMGAQPEGFWAPNSSAAAVFQDGELGRQLVLYQPAGQVPWHPIALTQATNDRGPLWSPDSKALSLPTRTSVASALHLTLVSPTDDAIHDVDSVPSGGAYAMGPYSAAGDFFVYVKTTSAAPATEGYFVDLRQGVAKASQPVAIPGALGARDFASTGAELVYVRDAKSCAHIDLAAAAPEPKQVNKAGTVLGCTFQKLPK
jgi:Tol biopolymer transport system component